MAKQRSYRPNENLLLALEGRAGQISKDLDSQDVANILWAMAKMGREPGERIMGLLEGRAGQISKELNSQDVANILWAMATMGRKPVERIMGLLEARVGEISKEFNFQAISLTLWAFGRLGCIPGVEMLGHLNRLSQDPATHFTEEQAACCMWATAVCHMTLPTFFVTRAGSISSWGDKSILSICDAARMFPPIDNHQTGALMNKTIPLAPKGAFRRAHSICHILLVVIRYVRTSGCGNDAQSEKFAACNRYMETYTLRGPPHTTHLGGLHAVLRQPAGVPVDH